MKSRLMGDGLFGPDLSLAHAKQVFFFLLIGFDLPSIKVSLQDLSRIGVGIGDQQVGRVAIEAMTMSVIGQWRDDDQPQRVALSATTPENGANGFVSELVATAGCKDRGALPG